MQMKYFELIKPGTNHDFVKYRRVAVTFSLIVNALILIGAIVWPRLNYGVDFAGGTELQVKFDKEVAAGDVREVVSQAGFGEPTVQEYGNDSVDVVRTEYVGPQVGKQLRNDGILAVIYAIGMILIYVGFRFDFRFSPGVVIALIHDAIVTLGYFLVTRHEFNLTSVTVILTVVGYSVNDTIVIYDRIRENAKKFKGLPLRDLINRSINEMLGRTILTSGATALSLVGLIVYGVGTIQDFALAMLVGIISGTYSTWYIASPMTIWLEEHMAHRKAIEAAKPKVKPAPKPPQQAAAR